MIKHDKGTISSVIVTSVMGHGGAGAFPLSLLSSYKKVVKTILETKTTVIAKSATRFKRKGNYRWWAPWLCVKQIRDKKTGSILGLLNAYDLSNDGVEACALEIKEAIGRGFRVIPSYFPELTDGKVNFKGLAEAVEIYGRILGKDFWALEYNASCPNSGESLEGNIKNVIKHAQGLRAYFDGCLIAKVSPVHPLELSLELEAVGVDVIHALNTFPHTMLFPAKKSPLEHLGGGGYSGSMIFEQAFAINSQLRQALTIPMILGGGISKLGQARKYKEMFKKKLPWTAHNNSIAICSVIRTDPYKAIDILRRVPFSF